MHNLNCFILYHERFFVEKKGLLFLNNVRFKFTRLELITKIARITCLFSFSVKKKKLKIRLDSN